MTTKKASIHFAVSISFTNARPVSENQRKRPDFAKKFHATPAPEASRGVGGHFPKKLPFVAIGDPPLMFGGYAFTEELSIEDLGMLLLRWTFKRAQPNGTVMTRHGKVYQVTFADTIKDIDFKKAKNSKKTTVFHNMQVCPVLSLSKEAADEMSDDNMKALKILMFRWYVWLYTGALDAVVNAGPWRHKKEELITSVDTTANLIDELNITEDELAMFDKPDENDEEE